MAAPFRPSPPAPGGCGGDRCASGRDAWPLHHFLHEGVFCRLCSSCVLLYRPSAFCSACLHLLSTSDAAATAPAGDPAVSPPGPTAPCSVCGLSVAHLSCVAGDPASFVCPPCAAAAENRPFSFTPAPPAGGGGRRTLDERDARVLLVAARLAHDSVSRAAAAARELAERRVAEAAAARKRSREMLDAAFRALEAETREAKMRPAPAAQLPKKKAPKSAEANRDKDRLLKLNAMQQPALAFAAAAAAAAAVSSMPLATVPPPREDKKPVKQEAQGSAPPPPPREDRPALFGALQS
ncbi:hypothetical protein PAHAL_3G109600 [Panicum hallii]|uniref:Uncharacterized protein n=1 Tax=Panicum hallii TaxID=206008 RepID=A0A2S3H7W8_9POAL|nr:angiomotin-like [Panicum hallii]PAN17128.1 hypothetical protein PAHAL_3G109600 [Panicum hallii]PAN17129.1 hypothetical protein PAHAL_3G109600 [Panicum hallii]